MAGLPRRLGNLSVAVVTFGLAWGPTRWALAQEPVDGSTDGAAEVPIQRPSGAAAIPAPEETGPESATGEPMASEFADNSATDADPAPAPEMDGIAPDLLAADEPDPSPAGPTARPESAPLETDEAALRRRIEARHRPASNPGRLNISVRTQFANAGGPNRVGGRLGGAQVDVGQSWNSFGYGITASAWGGRIFLPRETGAEMNSMFGIGPTVGLGRRALIQRGFLDLRLGYDFFYGVVNERRDSPASVSPQGDTNVALVQAENLIPHGPRATLSLGFFSLNAVHRRYVHGFGASIGYQGLAGSLRGELPFTHMLTLGVAYWMG
jgi:hypothetical protein